MKVIEKLTTELQIELVVKLCDPFHDVFGLHFQIFLIVETCFHSHYSFAWVLVLQFIRTFLQACFILVCKIVCMNAQRNCKVLIW